MNRTEARKLFGELYAKWYWHVRGSFLIKNVRYVIMVKTEEGEPLFWNNHDGWIGDVDNAEKYPKGSPLMKRSWLPYFLKDVTPEYVIYERAKSDEIEWRLKQHEYPLERNERNNTVERYSIGGRYQDTFMVLTHVLPGEQQYWKELPNKQDAHYYQNWYNCKLLKTACYAEGDLTVVTAESVDKFMEEITAYQMWAMEAGYAVWPIPFHEIKQEAEKWQTKNTNTPS